MNATAVTKAYPSVAQSAGWEPSPIWRFIDRYTPSQGWDTFLLLFLAVGTVAVTVRQADWVDTQDLVGGLISLYLSRVASPAKLRRPSFVIQPPQDSLRHLDVQKRNLNPMPHTPGPRRIHRHRGHPPAPIKR